MRRMMAILVALVLGLATGCDGAETPTAGPNANEREAAEDLCSAFNAATLNVYDEPSRGSTELAADFDQSTRDFDALNEPELATIARQLGTYMRERASGRQAHAYSNPAASRQAVRRLQKRFQSTTGVDRASYTSRQEEYERFFGSLRGSPQIHSGHETSNVPDCSEHLGRF